MSHCLGTSVPFTVPWEPADAPARLASTWLPLLRESLARRGRLRWPLRGNSMAPTLPPECEIEIVPLLPRVRLGDLIVFVADDTLVAHRLVHRSRGCWITQGDGRAIPDRPVDPSQVLGVVAAAYLDGRRCWPGTLSRFWAMLWVARYHLLRALQVGRRLRL